MTSHTTQLRKQNSHIRYLILVVVFLITSVNYTDRATLSIAGSSVAKELGLDPGDMGLIFSAFGWAYLVMQIPGGWLLDKYGSKKVYTWSLFFWSIFTFLQGFVELMPLAWTVISLFFLRFMLGFSEAPSFPANARIVAAWFPTNERATATACFNAGQYFALALFSPLLGWLTFAWGWQHVFTVMGIIGFILTFIWVRYVHNPSEHPMISRQELKYITDGGAIIDMDTKSAAKKSSGGWTSVKQMLTNRMLMGVFLGQYFINSITWFFLTWFPIYLVQQRGMSILNVGFIASIPAICGFAGGILGGVCSDWLLKKGMSITAARKIPIVFGMLLATSLILCNYIESHVVVVSLMALAFFGKGFGALGWTVVSDVAPKEAASMCGGLFNAFGNVASIVTPLVIGYLVKEMHSFNSALIFVGASAIAAMLCYLLVVGKISRMELKM
ncbi:TPA: MFS transporter [Salmonella enterica subsp. enterica serovar Virchow]|nr:MFS transporter [Salmonella enterica subsp. enterica serovar Aschersleben]EEJ7260295.1 MFS transporter [Salmonella enterica subsp. enterica]MID10620.1 MFS transporter [Salmonella enterica]HBK8692062.1 MFS transporter [Salmonella enterica subsp. enterica serovar Virchow]